MSSQPIMKNFAEYLTRYAQPLILASTFVSACLLAHRSADRLHILQIDAHARAGRASDLNSIRKELHTYVPEAILENGVKIPPLRSSQVREQDPSVGTSMNATSLTETHRGMGAVPL